MARQPKDPPSGRYSQQRVDELEIAIAYLRARQALKPKRDAHGWAILAKLIEAFEDRLAATRAGLDDVCIGASAAPDFDD